MHFFLTRYQAAVEAYNLNGKDLLSHSALLIAKLESLIRGTADRKPWYMSRVFCRESGGGLGKAQLLARGTLPCAIAFEPTNYYDAFTFYAFFLCACSGVCAKRRVLLPGLWWVSIASAIFSRLPDLVPFGIELILPRKKSVSRPMKTRSHSVFSNM